MYDILRGLIVAYCYSQLVLPADCGTSPTICPTIHNYVYKGSIVVSINNETAIHVHHWMICIAICLFYIFYDISTFMLSFCVGMSIQGLSYADCFDIICPNPYHM